MSLLVPKGATAEADVCPYETERRPLRAVSRSLHILYIAAYLRYLASSNAFPVASVDFYFSETLWIDRKHVGNDGSKSIANRIMLDGRAV